MKDKICGIFFIDNVNLDCNSISYKILESTLKKQILYLLKIGYHNFYIVYNYNILNIMCFEILQNIKAQKTYINLFVFLPIELTKQDYEYYKDANVIKVKAKTKQVYYKKIEKHIINNCNIIISEKLNGNTKINQKKIQLKRNNIIFIEINKI